jgi:NAD(P)-dependent dehydrogenase (short-subunit alcohol dehydrogenase family)
VSEKELLGKTAIVTGGARGIGKAIAFELSSRGAAVIVADLDEVLGNQVAKEISSKGGGSTLSIGCDLRKEADVQEMLEKTISAYSRVDVLVNNAGIWPMAPLWEMATQDWDNIMEVNLRGAYLCIKHVIPHMIRQKSGRVINMSSAIGREAQPMMVAYAISKAGIIAMTVGLAKEVAAYGITVNAVCPGPVETPGWDEPKKRLAKILDVPESQVVNFFTQKQLIKIPFKPEDIARVVCWLTSDDTKMMTGQAIGIDGGHNFPSY